MTRNEAIAVARRLNAGNGRCWAYVTQDRIVFTGGEKGSHSLDFRCSTLARVHAHWEGYIGTFLASFWRTTTVAS